MFVLLHELAHYINKKDYGHTDEWRRIFKIVLQHGQEIGIYDPLGEQPPVDYCQGEEEYFTLF